MITGNFPGWSSIKEYWRKQWMRTIRSVSVCRSCQSSRAILMSSWWYVSGHWTLEKTAKSVRTKRIWPVRSSLTVLLWRRRSSVRRKMRSICVWCTRWRNMVSKSFYTKIWTRMSRIPWSFTLRMRSSHLSHLRSLVSVSHSHFFGTRRSTQS